MGRTWTMVEHGQWSGMDNGRAWTMVGHGRDSPGNILPETSSAPARAKYTVRTGKMIEDAAETFTTESGMVKMPCDHSLIHVEQLVRELCSPAHTLR